MKQKKEPKGGALMLVVYPLLLTVLLERIKIIYSSAGSATKRASSKDFKENSLPVGSSKGELKGMGNSLLNRKKKKRATSVPKWILLIHGTIFKKQGNNPKLDS